MLTATQIALIIRDEHRAHNGADRFIETAAEKIVAAMPDYPAMLVSAAALENETTATLMDMLAATILTTLFEEEGGGRANISYSPASMDYMMKNWEYTAESDGMVRTVRVQMRMDSPINTLEGWKAPSNRHSLVPVEEPGYGGQAKPQAAEHVYDRPLWVVAYQQDTEDDETRLDFILCADQKRAQITCREMPANTLPRVENRHCMHTTCPASGCAEVASS